MKKFLWRSYVRPDRWLSGRLTILALLTFLCVSHSFALTLKDLQKKITVNFTEAPLKEVLNEVQRQSGIIIMYSSEKLDVSKKVTVNVKDAEVRDVLTLVLVGSGLTFDVVDSYILIKPSPVEETRPEAGEIQIIGHVGDEDGLPLPGATVIVKETRVGVTTDGNGSFALKTRQGETTTLLFSFVGLKTQEVVYNGVNPVNIQLKRDDKIIGDVVVTGYQNLDKQRVAGAVSKVERDDMNFNTINSIEQALQGKLPGVTVLNTTGEVGVRQRTRVRGTSTFMGNQEPIWVVDGIIQEDPLPFSTQTLDSEGGISEDNFDFIRNYVGNSISWLNPNDIDDITVLKDASATAIYGVRAANGVIVIRTKQGEVGPLSVSYSLGLNVAEQVTYDKLELMNSRERVAVSREIFERGLVASFTNNNIGYAGALQQYLNKELTYDEFNAQVARMESVNTDWFNILFRNPFSQSHHVSLSGGNQKMRIYSSLGYTSQNGTAIGNDQNTLNASIGFNSQVNEKLNVSFRLSGSKSETNGFNGLSPYEYASTTNRAIPAYDEDGELYYYVKDNGFLFNYINERDQSGNTNTSQSINSNLNLQYNILPELKLNVLGSYNISSTTGVSYATERTNSITAIRGYEYGTVSSTDDAYAQSRLPIGGLYNEDDNKSSNWNFRSTLSYDKVFNQKHALTTMIGFEMQSAKYDGYASTVYGYLHDRGKSFAKVPPTITSYGYSLENGLLDEFDYTVTDKLTNNVGYYLTLNYAYDGRYVANFSVRGDASNRFGQYPNEKFNPVWAGGARWNVNREKWMQDVHWVSGLSLRGTYGFQRNMATDFSPSLIVRIPNTTATSQLYDANTGDYLLNISNLPYEDLRWEETTSYNIGADFSLFNNKVYFSGDYYQKKGQDMITLLSIPVEYGMETMPVNGGSMKNKGYELTLGFTPVRTGNFTWNLNLSTSKNKNEVTKVGTQNPTWKSAAQGSLFKEGYAVSSFWAFKSDGIDPETGYPIIDLTVAEGENPVDNPTSYMEYVGKLDPDFTGSLGNTFRYKQLSMVASFYLQLGGKKFLSPAYASSVMPTEYENLSSELNDRWTPENTSATIPGLPDAYIVQNPVTLPGTTNTGETLYEMYNYSTDRVVDASSLQLSMLTLNYNFGDNICKKLNCRSVTLGVSASNVFTIVSKDFQGRDAEVATGNQPRTRSYSLNLSVNF
ncbi:SusC/RagA family TonB-linked outer membrane protein [Mangrovibacterium diazotrophicum]|uniref:TonB-linked SusC/RagA family outer membrane protein n=1 Tax=Mangrovibacterium diazotrophicum TaxID=1261403 RepID=A0A419WAN0_9BACT|nr:SusC/RagA family TonB-linked outer membrane protein [Mangrovibacterium diazotrophicum]RKD92541.1 TonB-linked SusC/RagA family outer membrane protein [Mangrovibacterium diazotrophicum]